MDDRIKIGDYIIIQRQSYTKLHRFNKLDNTVVLGKDVVELEYINNQNYFSTFKMQMKTNTGRKRLYFLEISENVKDLKDILESIESGSDNRNIRDDGQSQSLSNEEILSMRTNFSNSKDLVSTLVANSKSFIEKTEFSQEKYIKKKEKKYFDHIQVRRPTIRLLMEIFYRQDPEKALGLRMDSLSQLVSYSGVCCNGNYLIYESGTSGLGPAALLNSMGSTGNARLVHMHPGNFAQKQAMLAMNWEEDHLKKCVSVNIYSVLRQYYQEDPPQPIQELAGEVVESKKRKLEIDAEDIEMNPPKKQDIDEPIKEIVDTIMIDNGNEILTIPEETIVIKKRPKWQIENEEAIQILSQKMDCLVIVAKEHPLSIAKELLQFLHPSRPVVIFSTNKEILMETYMGLRAMDKMVNVKLTSNWMRNYQVLPMRTHPAIQMQGSSGYLLVGYTIHK